MTQLSWLKPINITGNNGAHFTMDKKYRFALWRIWDKSKPLVMFIGLNPSTANQTEDDPTIRRVTRFAKDWNYGGFYMMNLFSFVTAYPEELETCKDPLCDNDYWLKLHADECELVVACWGNFKEAEQRGKDVVKLLDRTMMAFQINKNGSPKHPLYVAANKSLVNYIYKP